MAQVDWEHQGQHLHPISPHVPLTQELEITALSFPRISSSTGR